jgi:signal transduction histidine kinase
MRSLRARLLLGALLWTVVLVFVTNFVVLWLIRERVPGHVVHYGAMSLFAVGMLAIGLTLVHIGLGPVGRLRDRLAALRSGVERRVEGSYPTEVQALVDDLNALLDDRERSIARAQAHAGNLAHGLKTPLAVLGQEAARLTAAGQEAVGAEITQQVERMRRQVDYHLAHARAAASGAAPGTRCVVSPSAEALVRTLQRLHAERSLALSTAVPADHAVRCQREDLDEMLGNLLDNACKWARSRVAVSSSMEHASVRICVDDDGAGIEPSLRSAVLQRGVRADEGAAGSGLGLAIVRDLAALYGGTIELGDSPLGGLRATVKLPAA